MGFGDRLFREGVRPLDPCSRTMSGERKGSRWRVWDGTRSAWAELKTGRRVREVASGVFGDVLAPFLTLSREEHGGPGTARVTLCWEGFASAQCARGEDGLARCRVCVLCGLWKCVWLYVFSCRVVCEFSFSLEAGLYLGCSLKHVKTQISSEDAREIATDLQRNERGEKGATSVADADANRMVTTEHAAIFVISRVTQQPTEVVVSEAWGGVALTVMAPFHSGRVEA